MSGPAGSGAGWGARVRTCGVSAGMALVTPGDGDGEHEHPARIDTSMGIALAIDAPCIRRRSIGARRSTTRRRARKHERGPRSYRTGDRDRELALKGP